jgi:hypothetical protein
MEVSQYALDGADKAWGGMLFERDPLPAGTPGPWNTVALTRAKESLQPSAHDIGFL